MSTFVLPKFGTVDTSFLGFTIPSAGVYTVMSEASAGPTLLGNASVQAWDFELDDDGAPAYGRVMTQRQTVLGP